MKVFAGAGEALLFSDSAAFVGDCATGSACDGCSFLAASLDDVIWFVSMDIYVVMMVMSDVR